MSTRQKTGYLEAVYTILFLLGAFKNDNKWWQVTMIGVASTVTSPSLQTFSAFSITI